MSSVKKGIETKTEKTIRNDEGCVSNIPKIPQGTTSQTTQSQGSGSTQAPKK